MTETYPASELQSYPGGPAAWVRAMSAKATRAVSRSGELMRLRMTARIEDAKKAAKPVTPKGKKPHAPNETEKRYRDEFLVPRIVAGEIADCEFEGKTYVLADGPKREDKCEYTPDWYCRLPDGTVECHEVKGPQVWGDSRIKYKWAKDKFRDVKWVWAQWRGGKWHVKESN